MSTSTVAGICCRVYEVCGGSQCAWLRSRVVDSISCRQMYLRSYAFLRTETVSERTKKCFRRVKQRVAAGKENNRKSWQRRLRRRHRRQRILVDQNIKIRGRP
ncbi:uncharacterized protein Fot_54651 [Forsythia ovata]|uniref:Uncharacterized protein n=1 Tax=Forsythia ovata TaxID=205694 RepID=A0ABD1P694_9LAMI